MTRKTSRGLTVDRRRAWFIRWHLKYIYVQASQALERVLRFIKILTSLLKIEHGLDLFYGRYLYQCLLLLFGSFQVNAGAVNGWKGLKHFVQ